MSPEQLIAGLADLLATGGKAKGGKRLLSDRELAERRGSTVWVDLKPGAIRFDGGGMIGLPGSGGVLTAFPAPEFDAATEACVEVPGTSEPISTERWGVVRAWVPKAAVSPLTSAERAAIGAAVMVWCGCADPACLGWFPGVLVALTKPDRAAPAAAHVQTASVHGDCITLRAKFPEHVVVTPRPADPTPGPQPSNN